MLEAFSNVGKGFIHRASGWDSNDQLPGEEVRDIYERAAFVLCPRGNAHHDTFRIMEALQAGSIPVGIEFLGRDYFSYTFGRHPFVVGKTWGQAAERVSELLEDRDGLAALREEVRHWYQRYLRDLRSDIRVILQGGSRRELTSAYLRTQRRSVFDLPLLARNLKYFLRFRLA
jgi:hypothetical protein